MVVNGKSYLTNRRQIIAIKTHKLIIMFILTGISAASISSRACTRSAPFSSIGLFMICHTITFVFSDDRCNRNKNSKFSLVSSYE
jgi:uncharacterized membrane protein